MPPDRQRHQFRPSGFRLPAIKRRSDPICFSTTELLRQINRTAVSPKSGFLNSQTALGTVLHSPVVTADAFNVTLPVPPSINHQYATVNGRRLLSSAGRAYKAYAGQQVWLTLAQSPIRLTLLERFRSGPLALSIRFFFASALRRDLDGGLKIAQDAICEGLGLNDNRIIETHLYKRVDKANPRIEVSLSFLQPLHHPA